MEGMRKIAGIVFGVCCAAAGFGADKKIVFVAGPASHGPGEHEYRAGCLLLQKGLRGVAGLQTVVYSNGWPAAADAFDGADAIVLSMGGGGEHPALQDDHLRQLGALMEKGVGLACIHWAVEPTREKGETEFLKWLGGAYETNWSVNPTWTAKFTVSSNHPITRGVKPFTMYDEWYFHLRFPEGMQGVTPILSAVPPENILAGQRDGAHSGNPAVREAIKRGERKRCVGPMSGPAAGAGLDSPARIFTRTGPTTIFAGSS